MSNTKQQAPQDSNEFERLQLTLIESTEQAVQNMVALNELYTPEQVQQNMNRLLRCAIDGGIFENDSKIEQSDLNYFVEVATRSMFAGQYLVRNTVLKPPFFT